ncbi:YwiC-like family protein [Flavimobilis soli]|uniref:YwiC-like family protein n=1 Tax=Flavimobilis soli TaxID=442709 RepID=UPI001FE3A073|nr:YwiC-like family protein [Flavimobilis soli]
MATPPATRRRRRRPTRGWVPDQHGAWAMLVVPLVVGVVASGGAWVHVPLALLWIVGYLAFFATGQWLRSRRKPRYLPPVRAYALACAPLGAVVALAEPRLLRWVPVFLPLLVVSLWCSHRRKDRSLVNDAVSVTAACLMLPVAYDAGRAPTDGWPAVWLATALVLAYFVGTAFYVKTIIRERGNRTYLALSLAYHAAMVPLPLAAAAIMGRMVPGTSGSPVATLDMGPLVALNALLLLRALAVPRTGATPKQVGVGEILVSTTLTVLLLVKVV